MESLGNVEKECEKSMDLFDNFYSDVDQNVTKVIDYVVSTMSDLVKIDNDQSLKAGATTSVQTCKEQIKEFIKNYSDKHKDLHANVSKIGKVIDKNFVADYGNLPQVNILDTKEKQVLLNQVIHEHLLRNGHIEIADSLANEVEMKSQIDEERKAQFVSMNHILTKLKEKDVQPALDWCQSHSAQLKEINSNLEFNLHKLNFIKIIVEQGTKAQASALKYARNFTPFASQCAKEIQRLMASLLYISTGLKSSPYNSYLSEELWQEVEEEFVKNCCKLMGMPTECPLNICINAGCKGLPALINILQVMQQTQVGHVLSKDELPIEIDIGTQSRYHSVFTCPILRQQSTDQNPPMRLVCGHVISKDALLKLSSTGKLKCPYCPVEQSPADARQMYF